MDVQRCEDTARPTMYQSQPHTVKMVIETPAASRKDRDQMWPGSGMEIKKSKVGAVLYLVLDIVLYHTTDLYFCIRIFKKGRSEALKYKK